MVCIWASIYYVRSCFSFHMAHIPYQQLDTCLLGLIIHKFYPLRWVTFHEWAKSVCVCVCMCFYLYFILKLLHFYRLIHFWGRLNFELQWIEYGFLCPFPSVFHFCRAKSRPTSIYYPVRGKPKEKKCRHSLGISGPSNTSTTQWSPELKRIASCTKHTAIAHRSDCIRRYYILHFSHGSHNLAHIDYRRCNNVFTVITDIIGGNTYLLKWSLLSICSNGPDHKHEANTNKANYHIHVHRGWQRYSERLVHPFGVGLIGMEYRGTAAIFVDGTTKDERPRKHIS